MAYDWRAAVEAAKKKANQYKNTGVYQTLTGGEVKGQTAGSQAAEDFNKALETGQYKTKDNGEVSTSSKNTSGSTKKKQPVIEDTLEERISAYTPAATTKKNPDTGGYDWQSAVKAATDSANKQKEDKALLTRDYTRVNYTPYLDDETEDRTTDISSDAKSTYTAPNAGYSLPATDPGINYDTINMLLTRYGMQPVNGKIGGVPVEALYLGDNQYALPYLLDNPDSQQMYSNGNLITVGDYKKALMDGFLKSGNEAAYNDWIAGVAQNPNVKTLSAYEYEEPTAYEESGESNAYRDYIDAAVEAILGQKSGIDQEAAAAKQLAYENYMRTKLGLGEQTSGMATGMADSLMLQNDLTLQNNLTGIDQDRLNAYADIDSQAAQMEAEGNLQLTQMAEERRREAEERARQEREWAYQLEQDRIEAAEDAQNKAYDDALTAYKAGIRTPEVLTALGMEVGEPIGAAKAINDIKTKYGNAITQARVDAEIQNWLAKGQISETEAEYIANQFGMTYR